MPTSLLMARALGAVPMSVVSDSGKLNSVR